MGVWGTSIFSDDTASDVRGDYRDLAGNGLAGHEATDKILREYYRQRESEMGVVRLALAATQWNCGRLEERVQAKALEIIESGSDLKRWTGKAFERKRGAALSKLRGMPFAGDQLEGLSIRMGSGTSSTDKFREFPAQRLARLNAKLEPSETSEIKIRHPWGPIGFKGGGLPFALWRTFDQHLETYYGLR
jgi:hypothetical protein